MLFPPLESTRRKVSPSTSRSNTPEIDDTTSDPPRVRYAPVTPAPGRPEPGAIRSKPDPVKQ
jgi:hypothetical protein